MFIEGVTQGYRGGGRDINFCLLNSTGLLRLSGFLCFNTTKFEYTFSISDKNICTYCLQLLTFLFPFLHKFQNKILLSFSLWNRFNAMAYMLSPSLCCCCFLHHLRLLVVGEMFVWPSASIDRHQRAMVQLANHTDSPTSLPPRFLVPINPNKPVSNKLTVRHRHCSLTTWIVINSRRL